MKFEYEAQKKQLDVKNLDLLHQEKKNEDLVPFPARILVVGASNSGKTNIIVTLVTHLLGLKFERVFLFCRTLQQEKYQFLLKVLDGIVYASETIEPIDFPKNSLIIFDDCQLEDHDVIKRIFAYGRHMNISILYAAQSYRLAAIPLIRENINYLVVLRQDLKNLRHIHEDHVAPDVSFSDLLKLCRNSWGRDFGFFVIDKQNSINSGRYRDGFSLFIKCLN